MLANPESTAIISPEVISSGASSRIRRSLARLMQIVAITMVAVTAQADGGMPLQDQQVYAVPENLTDLSTQEINDLRESHIRDLDKMASNVDEEQQAEEELFEQLMEHDLVRLTIADVIAELIQEYQIEGEFKKTLMGYRSTFSEDLMRSREAVENLDDYPSYDFRFAAVYMSMLYAFQKYPDFYDRLKLDMVNDETHIGQYRKELDSSYVKVKQARAEMEFATSGDELKEVIAALDEELARRAK